MCRYLFNISNRNIERKVWWNLPLKVSSGTLSCEHPTLIVFTTSNGQKYGVNGSATHQYNSILEIVNESENLGVTFKMPIGFLIEEGMKLCNQWF